MIAVVRFILLVCVLMVTPSHAHNDQGLKSCRKAIARHARRTLVPGSSPLMLPPGGRRNLSGVMIEDNEGDGLLALGGYRIRHSTLEKAIRTAIQRGELGSGYTYKWLGELTILNNRQFEAPGKIIQGNEVAGYWATVVSEWGDEHENKIKNLRRMAQRHFSSLVSSQASFLTYSDSVRLGRLHFCDRLNVFLQDFDTAMAERLLPEKETWRHYVGNIAGGFLSQVEAFVDNQHDYETLVPMLERTLRNHQSAEEFAAHPSFLKMQAATLYLEWLQNDGVFPEATKEMLRYLQLFRERGLSTEEWRAFAAASAKPGIDWSNYADQGEIENEVELIYFKPIRD